MIGDTENFVLGMLIVVFGFWFGFSVASASAFQLGLFLYRHCERRWQLQPRAAKLNWRKAIGLSSMLILVWAMVFNIIRGIAEESNPDFGMEESMLGMLIPFISVIPVLLVAYPVLTYLFHLDKKVTLWLLGAFVLLLPVTAITGMAIGALIAFPIISIF